MLLLYIALRRNSARDWISTAEIRYAPTAGDDGRSDHHIYPQSLDGKIYVRRKIDSICNLTFLSKKSNSEIYKTPPWLYPPTYTKHFRSHLLSNSLLVEGRKGFDGFLKSRSGELSRAFLALAGY
jgi:hypothetical protein